MDFLIECLLILLILFSPLIYGSVTALPLSIVESLSFILLFIFLLKQIIRKDCSLIKIPVLWLLAFIAYSVLQLFNLPFWFVSVISPATVSLFQNFKPNPVSAFFISICPEATVALILQFLSYLCIFFVTINSINTFKQLRRLALVLVLSGFAYAIYGFLSGTGIHKNSFSTFTNRDHFAAYIGMIIPIGIGYSLSELRRWLRPILIFLVSVMVLALFFSFSRAGVISFCISIFIFMLLLRLKKPVRKWLMIMIGLFVSIGISLALIGTGSIAMRLKTLLSPFAAYEPRFTLLIDSLNIVRDFFLCGTGLGTFGEIIQKYNTSDLQVSWFFAHNEPVNLLVESGFIGFLFITAFAVLFMRHIFSVIFKRSDPSVIYMTLGVICGIISITLHSFFDFVFHIPANGILFAFILALAYRSAYMKEPQEALPLPQVKFNLNIYSRIVFTVLLAIGFISAGSLIWSRYAAEAIFRNIDRDRIIDVDTKGIIKYTKAVKGLDAAIKLNPINSRYYSKKADLLSELFFKDESQYAVNVFNEFKSKGRFYSALEQLYSKAINLNPTKADYHLRLAWVYGKTGRISQMDAELKKAGLLDPKNNKLGRTICEYFIKFKGQQPL